jgi:hypothetical protein
MRYTDQAVGAQDSHSRSYFMVSDVTLAGCRLEATSPLSSWANLAAARACKLRPAFVLSTPLHQLRLERRHLYRLWINVPEWPRMPASQCSLVAADMARWDALAAQHRAATPAWAS